MTPAELADAARLTATAPPADAARAVAAAAADGRRAALAGGCVPLHVLLDVRAGIGRQMVGRRAMFPDPGRKVPPAACHDRWLTRLLDAIAARGGAGTLDPLPLLLGCWPADPTGSRAWAAGYEEVGREPGPAVAAWRRERPTDAAAWAAPPSLPVGPAELAAATAARFAADCPTLSPAVDLDQRAAAGYFAAPDPTPTRQQAARARRLLLVRAERQRPTTEAAEEQHPAVGLTTIWTLTLGEYGEFRRANNADPRIATPPRARTPATFQVYLCWGAGYRADRGPAGAALRTAVGLVVDDWRAALAGVAVRFRLRRVVGPVDRLDLRPGPRWKTTAVRDGGPVFAPGVCGHLFTRPPLADLAAAPIVWPDQTGDGAGPRWWCGAMAATDLPDVGFAPLPAADRPDPGWTSSQKGAVPAALSHVLVVDGDAGWVCRVGRAADRTTLTPVPTRHRAAGDGWQGFRLAALDALLDALLNPPAG